MVPRIIICGMILIIHFSTNTMAGCNLKDSNQRYCPTGTPYELQCVSTVDGNEITSCIHREFGHTLRIQPTDYSDIKINLQNPDDNPFLANVAFYTEVTIEDGYLVTVPSNLYNMTRLRQLKISTNKLCKVNFNDFLALESLKSIDLTNNTIIVIETEERSSNYSTVQDIDISYNSIEVVPNNFLKRFIELKHLNMSNNLISSIESFAFEGTFNLKILDVSHNKLHALGNIVSQLPRLIEVNYGTHQKLQKLSKLVLDTNLISKINFTEFFETGVQELNIGDNQISCSEMARVKYSSLGEKFNRIVTAKTLHFQSDNIDGISCLLDNNANSDVVDVSDVPNSNSSILISMLRTEIKNYSKSLNAVMEILNQNERKWEQFMESTNFTLTSIRDELLTIKKDVPKEYTTNTAPPPRYQYSTSTTSHSVPRYLFDYN